MKNKERVANKLKELGNSSLKRLNKSECPLFLTAKTPLREKFNTLFLSKNITEWFYEKHSDLLNQAFNAGSQWSPILKWYLAINLYFSEQIFSDYNHIDLKAQNIILQYIQEKVIEKIPDSDTNLQEILNCIKRVIDRNILVLNTKEKKKRDFCLQHSSCSCDISQAQICPYRNCGFYSNSIQEHASHLITCKHYETYSDEYNEQIKNIQEANLKKKSLNSYYLHQLVKNCSEFSIKFGRDIKQLTRPYNNENRKRQSLISPSKQKISVLPYLSTKDQTFKTEELQNLDLPQGLFKASVPTSYSDNSLLYDQNEKVSVSVSVNGKKDILAQTIELNSIMFDPCFGDSDYVHQQDVQHINHSDLEENNLMLTEKEQV